MYTINLRVYNIVQGSIEITRFSYKMSECSKRPISQLVLITDIFSYKTVQFGECRPIIH